MNKCKLNRQIERDFCNEEKIKLIKYLSKDERFYPARLAKIFNLTRERIRQILDKKK